MGMERHEIESADYAMSDFTITFDDQGLSNALDRAIASMPVELAKVSDKTAAFGLRTIKEELIPVKRSGNLAKGYLQRETGKFSREIYSTSRYAVANEEGANIPDVFPKRRKFLTIPLNDSVLTGTRAQISQPAMNRLFKLLKARKPKTKDQRFEVFKEAGIVLAKKAKAHSIRGNHIIRDRVVPKIADFFQSESTKMLGEVF